MTPESAAMKQGRSHRALEAVKDHPQGMHSIPLRSGGFISVAELACRYAEREACHRAAKSCKTFETASDAVRILEQPTPTLDRRNEMLRMWRVESRQSPLGALQVMMGDEGEEEADAFDDAFGDWAPAWMLAGADRMELTL